MLIKERCDSKASTAAAEMTINCKKTEGKKKKGQDACYELEISKSSAKVSLNI